MFPVMRRQITVKSSTHGVLMCCRNGRAAMCMSDFTRCECFFGNVRHRRGDSVKGPPMTKRFDQEPTNASRALQIYSFPAMTQMFSAFRGRVTPTVRHIGAAVSLVEANQIIPIVVRGRALGRRRHCQSGPVGAATGDWGRRIPPAGLEKRTSEAASPGDRPPDRNRGCHVVAWTRW